MAIIYSGDEEYGEEITSGLIDRDAVCPECGAASDEQHDEDCTKYDGGNEGKG